MRRLGYLCAFAVLGLVLVGCGDEGGVAGPPKDAPKSSMTDSHRAFMEKNAGKMQGLMKGKPKNTP